MTDRRTDHSSDDDSALMDALAALEPADLEFDAPPASVWNAIAGVVDPQPSDGADLAIEALAPPRRHVSRWRRQIGPAAAVAAIIIAVTVAVVARTDNHPADVIAQTTLSSAGLAGAPTGLTGDARVIREGSQELVHVDIGSTRPVSGQYLEVWLIRPDISGMISLGAVRPDGNYQVPGGLQINEYPIVDISSEPYDGNPKHSGDSLLRGELH